MSVQLLDKTRKINKLLHNNNSTKVVFNDICKVMMETLIPIFWLSAGKERCWGSAFALEWEEITELIDDSVRRVCRLAAE